MLSRHSEHPQFTFSLCPFPLAVALGPFQPECPRKAALINHSADPRAWRTSLVGHANLHYEQRPSLCVCGLYYPMPLHYSFSLYYLNYVGPYQYSRQLHLDISPLIQSRASSLPSCTVHLLTSLVYFFLMRDARVILDRQIALVLPFDVENVLVLCRVRQRPLNQLARLWLGDPLEGAASLRGEVEGAKGTVL